MILSSSHYCHARLVGSALDLVIFVLFYFLNWNPLFGLCIDFSNMDMKYRLCLLDSLMFYFFAGSWFFDVDKHTTDSSTFFPERIIFPFCISFKFLLLEFTNYGYSFSLSCFFIPLNFNWIMKQHAKYLSAYDFFAWLVW